MLTHESKDCQNSQQTSGLSKVTDTKATDQGQVTLRQHSRLRLVSWARDVRDRL